MNTHDIELPAEFRSGNGISVERATITRSRMEEILVSAIEAYAKRIAELEQPADPVSTHHVHRGAESLPCCCKGKDDHPIDKETLEPVAWNDITEILPPVDKIPGDEIRVGRRVLVTNNIHSKDRTGRMSHVWFTIPIWDAAQKFWVAFDANGRKIERITHWFDPLNVASQPAKPETPTVADYE